MANKEYFMAVARKAALNNGLPPDVFLRQIDAESGWNPNARSPVGAQGIAQIMPGTAKGWGVDPTDPVASLNAAAKAMGSYFRTYQKQGHNTHEAMSRALAAYNAGPGNVKKYGGVPPFSETKNYVAKILKGWNPKTQAQQTQQPQQSEFVGQEIPLQVDPTLLAQAQNAGRQLEPLDFLPPLQGYAQMSDDRMSALPDFQQPLDFLSPLADNALGDGASGQGIDIPEPVVGAPSRINFMPATPMPYNIGVPSFEMPQLEHPALLRQLQLLKLSSLNNRGLSQYGQ